MIVLLVIGNIFYESVLFLFHFIQFEADNDVLNTFGNLLLGGLFIGLAAYFLTVAKRYATYAEYL